ncbi:MAG: nucleoside deaminase [Lentisphaeria bacterium]|nr:nucleoside deaminase [Lentisphaeria bacterium]
MRRPARGADFREKPDLLMNETFLKQAINLAMEHSAAGDGGPFGAVVVCDGEVVGRGWNAVTATPDPTAHAEIMAIRDAAKRLGTFDLSDCEIYSSCEPCPMCLCAIYWARIPRLMYGAGQADAAEAGFDDAEFYRQIALPVSERTLATRQAMRAEAVAVFDQWLENTKRVTY